MSDFIGTFNYDPAKRGDTLPGWSVQIEIDDVPVSIASAKMTIRQKIKGLPEVYDVPLSAGGDTVTVPDIPNTETISFPVDLLVYDLEVTLSSGVVRTWIEGNVPIVQDYAYV